MIITNRKPLFPEEEKMPLAKYYYNYPLHGPGPLEMQIIDNLNPMNPEDAIKPENFIDFFKPTGYDKMELGYCMFPDGSGYIATYRVLPPNITPEMERWYRRWRNLKSKSMVPGHGNLRYKVWMPADHVEHYFCNWRDAEQGIYTEESLDLGEGDRSFVSLRHEFDLKDYGMSDEHFQSLEDAGCKLMGKGKGTYETFDEPGSHIQVSYSRPCPLGGVETRSREWLGWRPENGKLVRDETTVINEEYMRKVVIHNCIEWPHLYSILPDLYAEYKDQPIDAD